MDRNNYFNTKLNRSRNGDDFNTNLENNHEQKSSLTTTTTTNLSTTTLQHQTKSSSISNDNNKMIMLKSLEPNQTIVLNEDESATLICLSEGGNYIYFCVSFRFIIIRLLNSIFLLIV